MRPSITLTAVSFIAALSFSALTYAEPLTLETATLDGKIFSLTEQRGKWVVVNFWATWCGPCIKEMPELDELDKAREDVVVVGLAFEETTVADLNEFLKKRPVSYPIALVDTFEPPAAFAVPKGLPTTHVIGPDGSIAKSFLGPVTRAELEAVVDSAAKATPAS